VISGGRIITGFKAGADGVYSTEVPGVVVLKPPHAVGHNAIRPRSGRWCYFENSFDLLDAPGEWHLDRRTGVMPALPTFGGCHLFPLFGGHCHVSE